MLAHMGNAEGRKPVDPLKIVVVVAAVVFAIGIPAIIIINVLIPWMECGGITTSAGAVLNC